MTALNPLLGLPLGLIALATAYQGMGLPNHPYQVTLGFLTAGLAYQRGWLKRPTELAAVALACLNALVLAVHYKLLIGGGVRTPFSWLQLPTVQTGSDGAWVPKIGLGWQAWALSQWSVDLTVLQSFLLLVTAVAGWCRFQPFASLTALLLLLASIPAFADFQWNWVLPSLLAAAVSFYVQAQAQAKTT